MSTFSPTNEESKHLMSFFHAGYRDVMILRVAPVPEMKDLYTDAVNRYRESLLEPCTDQTVERTVVPYLNAGFDVLTFTSEIVDNRVHIDTGVSCSALKIHCCDNGLTLSTPTSYFLMPRSSVATKYNMVMANSVGVIDAGFRGHLRGVFHPMNRSEGSAIAVGTRVMQVCAPQLCPIIPFVVDHLDETARGSNGFGSTGW